MPILYDSHLHTEHSPDSVQPLEEICETAIRRGLRGIAVTDHAELWHLEEQHTFREIAASAAEAKAADARYEGRLRVFTGIEIAEAQDDPENAAKLLNLADYDVALASCHSVAFDRWSASYFFADIPFDTETVPEETLREFLDAYFQKILRMAQSDDYDVLTHLTCPLRYINGKYHRNRDLRPWRDIIDEILRTVIRRGKALELNTSGIHGYYGKWMPDEEILQRYYDFGGRLLTLASDAHTADRVGNAFREAEELLQSIGFPRYCYYEHRQPRLCGW